VIGELIPQSKAATMRRQRISLIGLAAILASAVGCSDDYEGRMGISGTVKVKGQPIPDGAIIIFEPLENQGTGANMTLASGAYTLPRQYGLKPGKYLVRITAGDGMTAVNPVDANNPPGPTGSNIISKDIVPAAWNVNSNQQITVTKDGPNKFDFDIP
jgi:hypothetical protein